MKNSVDIYAEIDLKTGEVEELFNADGPPTAERIAAIEAKNAEIEALEVEAKAAEAQEAKMAEIRQKTAARRQSLDTPELPTRFSTGSPQSGHEKAARFVAGRIEHVEAEADKTKSLADQVRCITIALCPQLAAAKFGGFDGQLKAMERLEKVYGSVQSKTMTEGSGTAGGYTVAPQYNTELFKLMAEMSIVRPYANVKSIPGREAFFPMLNQTNSSAPTNGTNYAGGAYLSWTGEAQAESVTAEPNFKQVHLVTNELTALAQISRTLLSDSFLSIDAELRSIFATAVSSEEDLQFLTGDGASKPKGVTTSNALISVTRTTSNLFKLADAANMMGRMMADGRPRSVWVMGNDLFPQVVQLVDASGRVTYIPNVGSGYDRANLAAQLVLFGRPILFTEKTAALGSANDVMLCDFSRYIIADSGSLEIAVSDQYAFNKNVLTYRVIKRVDGRAQLDNPFTPRKGSTLSPFVGLAV